MILVGIHPTLLPWLQDEVGKPEVLAWVVSVQVPAVQVDGRSANVLDDRVFVALDLLDLAVVLGMTP
ncbi:MAG: hypothetical protein PVH41_17135 [Anaerolineae bacterium]|jgi:hypothetical protein